MYTTHAHTTCDRHAIPTDRPTDLPTDGQTDRSKVHKEKLRQGLSALPWESCEITWPAARHSRLKCVSSPLPAQHRHPSRCATRYQVSSCKPRFSTFFEYK